MPLRVAINGFGRIGRNALKVGWGRRGIQFVAINDLTEPEILAHNLKYDSVHGRWDHKVRADKKHIIIDGQKIPVYSEKDPEQIPWGEHKVDIVIESTGFFTHMDDASKHVKAGAKKVVISAPGKEVPTYLIGVNHTKLKKNENVICNASCTTNSVAPVAQIMDEAFGVKSAMLTTIHSATSGQNIVDGLPNPRKKDLRRARSALVNIIPTTTGAAKATTKAMPQLEGKFDGIAVRVPTVNVSLSDFTFVLKKNATVEQINAAFKKAAKNARWKGILAVTEDPVVSTDFNGSTYSSIVDLEMTRVAGGNLVKVLAWYDNEWGYSVRLIEMVEQAGRK